MVLRDTVSNLRYSRSVIGGGAMQDDLADAAMMAAVNNRMYLVARQVLQGFQI